MSGIVGVLLAAGAGSRFGSNKLMYRLPDGVPIAIAAANNLKVACNRIVAILRPEYRELSDQLNDVGCEIVFCPDAVYGMGHSLSAGVRNAADASGWIVALADMPFISRNSYLAVADCLRKGASLAATRYQGKRGHPVGLHKKWLPQLTAMSGDEGAKSILKAHPDELTLCDVDDPGVVWDIDCPQDLHYSSAAAENRK